MSVHAQVWVADKSAVYKIDPALGQVLLTVPAAKVLALAVDPRDKTPWVLTDAALGKWSSEGLPVASVDLKAVDMSGATVLAVDGRDGSAWIGEGGGSLPGESKSVMHVDLHGAVLQRIASPGQIRGIAVALDETVWILGAKMLYHYTSSGSALANIDLSPLVAGEPKLLQVDSIAAWILLAGEKRVLRVDATAATTAVLGALPFSADSVAVDETLGTFYVLAAGSVYPIDSSGMPGAGIDLGTYGISGASVAAFDSASQDLFVGHAAGVTRLDRSVSSPLLIPLPNAAEAIGTAPLLLETSVALLSPVAGSITNHALPTFKLELTPSCSGNPCGFAQPFFKTYSIYALLNSQQIGTSFVLGTDPGTFTYTPGSRLPEGTNTFVAHATDLFGQVSADLTVSWVIDTIPPSFVLLLPASPALTNQTVATVSGRISEAGSLIAAGSAIPLAADYGFSFVQPLVEGDNTIPLTATDLAGNSTTASLLITRDTIPPSFSGIAPVDGSTVSSANITLTGQTSEWATITVSAGNSQLGSATGTSFSFPLTLSSGLDQFTLTATDRAGNASSVILHITLSNPLSISITSPQPGATVSGSTLYVTGTIQSDQPVGVNVGGATATVVGTNFVAEVELLPDSNQITATATSLSGATATTSVSVLDVPSTSYVPLFDPTTGIAPFTVALTVPAGVAIQTDFDGDGVIDRYAQGPTTVYYSFTSPGIYSATSQVTDSSGTRTVVTPFVVQDVKALDKIIQATFSGMLDRLRASDIEGALQFFTPAAAERYRPILQSLSTQLPQVASGLGTISGGFISGELAEYLLVQNTPSGQQGFLIYLVLGPDGVWRIADM